MTPLDLIYVLIGAVAGVLAGLFGIGGGIVIVPMLVFWFTRQSVASQYIMHLALGTSLASIVFTSVSSFWSHHRRGAVIWPVVWKIAPGILVGTLGGTFLAARMSTELLKVFYAIFLYYAAVQMLVDRKPKASRGLPGWLGMSAVGTVIGIVSSLVGIGGGSLSVPFMVLCNLPVHQAIGTAAAIGFPIAVTGTFGYVLNGLGASGLPEYCLGYIYLPALAGIVCASVLTAPFGARLAHWLPITKLKRLFAVLLLVVATKLLVGLL